jgi:hypothetical protein
MGWSTLYYLKKPTCPKLIRMLFANMRINMESRIVSSLQNKHIEFDCDTLTKLLGIYNEGPRVLEVKSIPTIEDLHMMGLWYYMRVDTIFLLKQKLKAKSCS